MFGRQGCHHRKHDQAEHQVRHYCRRQPEKPANQERCSTDYTTEQRPRYDIATNDEEEFDTQIKWLRRKPGYSCKQCACQTHMLKQNHQAGNGSQYLDILKPLCVSAYQLGYPSMTCPMRSVRYPSGARIAWHATSVMVCVPG